MPRALFDDSGHRAQPRGRGAHQARRVAANRERGLNTVAKREQQWQRRRRGRRCRPAADELTHGSGCAASAARRRRLVCRSLANVATTMLARGGATNAIVGRWARPAVNWSPPLEPGLGFGGALAGLLLAAWLVRALGATSGMALPRQDGIGIDRSSSHARARTPRHSCSVCPVQASTRFRDALPTGRWCRRVPASAGCWSWSRCLALCCS
jgi:hypothetical protein